MIDRDALAALLVAVGREHHAAFEETDGNDPEWPLWYAEHLVPRCEAVLGLTLTRSEVVYLLVASARAQESASDDTPWPQFYASFITEELAGA